ncbi:MAG TPA: non-heme iron oxygenase ferredoxin subunit [Kineosporiaceae bacterium]|nr:non-heme iron oxygenase ferredoxin subunit [Kineosporiaceae bacterium]
MNGPQPVCTLAEVPEVGAVRVLVDGIPVAVVRDEEGRLHAVGDTCSHAEVSLAEGEVEDCSIECWLHGSRFDLVTGQPTSLPAILPIPVYPVTVDGEDVLVDVSVTVNAVKES